MADVIRFEAVTRTTAEWSWSVVSRHESARDARTRVIVEAGHLAAKGPWRVTSIRRNRVALQNLTDPAYRIVYRVRQVNEPPVGWWPT